MSHADVKGPALDQLYDLLKKVEIHVIKNPKLASDPSCAIMHQYDADFDEMACNPKDAVRCIVTLIRRAFDFIETNPSHGDHVEDV